MSIVTKAPSRHGGASFRVQRPAAAFTLVEVAMAMGVVSFCLVVLFGLLSAGLDSNRSAIEQQGANQLLSAVVSDLYATPAAVPRDGPGPGATSLQFGIIIPQNIGTSTNTYYFSNNFQTNASAAQSLYALTVATVVPSSGSGVKTATFMDLKVTWPAAAKATSAPGRVETFVGLNRN
jgi:uncharacterized protein (TIGR02598 family)